MYMLVDFRPCYYYYHRLVFMIVTTLAGEKIGLQYIVKQNTVLIHILFFPA